MVNQTNSNNQETNARHNIVSASNQDQYSDFCQQQANNDQLVNDQVRRSERLKERNNLEAGPSSNIAKSNNNQGF